MTNEELIKRAVAVTAPKTIADATMGGVGCALLTDKGTVFMGVCIDTISGMGFCAEHNAISTMITVQEYIIKKIVAVLKDEKGNTFILPPCGRCREFMKQTNPDNLKAEVILAKDKSVLLEELLPYHDWLEKI